ncbi:hypothetical protein HU200_056158 [Digitaria exilis]|uniref:Cystatin domain-containing protein n=1 Tax=Digitaria exilis TaxID=1010633 RepID=A0A835AG64_9POAL|nr:hypothetical protein HU200_056158 [Digitaria exilis]CAB3480311.1 unnamed protein product [Digitaria exilis]
MYTRGLRLLAVAALLVVVVGYYAPIIDVSDPYIQELGSWAVSEYLRQGHSDGLLYGQVLSGGQCNDYKFKLRNYKLILDAMDTTATVKNYKALVVVKWSRIRRLVSFELA